MKRRDFVKGLGVSSLVLASGASLIGCSKKSLVAWAGTIVTSLEQALPILSTLSPVSVALVTKAIETARALKAALAAGSENAIEFLNQLLAPDGLFLQILAIVATVPGPQQIIISGILALAGVALNLIATALAQGSTGAPPALVAKVKSRNIAGTSVIEAAANSDRLLKAAAALK